VRYLKTIHASTIAEIVSWQLTERSPEILYRTPRRGITAIYWGSARRRRRRRRRRDVE